MVILMSSGFGQICFFSIIINVGGQVYYPALQLSVMEIRLGFQGSI